MLSSSPAKISLDAFTTMMIRFSPSGDWSTEKYFRQFGAQSWLMRARKEYVNSCIFSEYRFLIDYISDFFNKVKLHINGNIPLQ